MNPSKAGFELFTTCPVSTQSSPRAAVRRLEEVAAWSELAGCEGMLVFADNRQLDPWLVAQVVIEATEALSPLVAVQPAYMHPYSVAKLVSSLAFLHDRRVYLNMVAGGFRNDLLALGDATPHDERYARLVEYTTIIQRLLTAGEPVSFDGSYYSVRNLRMTPPVAPALVPGVFVAGSSAAGRDAAAKLGATAVEYPKPAAELSSADAGASASRGIRIGIIARDDESEAWSVAHARYPADRKGRIARHLATKVSDSKWHQDLARRGAGLAGEGPYWLVPFENYKAMCPYLVGSYERVAGELASYVDHGYRTFILDEPASAEEMEHIGLAFERTSARCVAA